MVPVSKRPDHVGESLRDSQSLMNEKQRSPEDP